MSKRITGYLFRRGQVWWCRFKYRGRTYPFSLKTDKEAYAKDEMRRQMTLRCAAMLDGTFANKYGRGDEDARGVTLRVGSPLPLSSAWQRYVACRTRPQSGNSTLKQYQYQFHTFVDWMWKAHPHATHVASVTQEMACQFLDFIEKRGVSANTFNKHVDTMRRIFRVLRDEAKALVINPWDGIQHKKGAQNRREAFTLAQMALILGKAEGEMKTLFFLGFFTGQRLGDCATLRFEDVDLTTGMLSVVPMKTRRSSGLRVDLPLHPDLKKHLLGVRAQSPSPKGFIIPEVAKRYDRDRPSLTVAIQRFLRGCGLEIHKPGTGVKGVRAVCQFGFHSTRHTFVSICRMAGVPDAVIQSIVGQSFRIYTHINMEAKTDAINRLPSMESSAPSVLSGGSEAMSDEEVHRQLDALQEEAARRGLRVKKSVQAA